MPKVLAWQCPKTGKLFVNKERYRAHLRKEAKKRITNRKILARKQRCSQEIAKLQRATSFSDIVDWLMVPENQMMLAIQNTDIERCPKFKDVYNKMGRFITDIRFEKMRYDDMCSNAHCYPANGVENWFRERDLPLGYAGWRGQILFKVNQDITKKWYGRELFIDTGIHLGSGGGSLTCSYNVTIFADDFANMGVLHKMMEKHA